MARIFITGSADGLGQAAARRLVALGHEVVLHGRNRDRAQEALRGVPGARTALEGDLASIEQTRELARQANEAGAFQAVIHNAGIGVYGARRETVGGGSCLTASRTRSIPDGFARRWAARPRPAASRKASRPRCGWRSAGGLARQGPVGLSPPHELALLTRPPP